MGRLPVSFSLKKNLFLPYFALLILTQHPSWTFANPIDDLRPGHWYEVPNSRMADVAPKPIPPGASSIRSVTEAWSGATYDTRRDRLIVWGGGHTAYAGNEIYAFDINTLKWMRLTNPSLNLSNGDPYPDGRPNSRHTYNGLVYIPPPVDRLWASGGSIWQTGHCSAKTWMYNFDARPPESGWSLQLTMGNDCGAVSGYDPISGRVIFLTQVGYSGPQLLAFDPKRSKSPWTVLNGSSAVRSLYQTGAVDPVRRKFVVLGGELVWRVCADRRVRLVSCQRAPESITHNR
jgi:hypothetical protein